MSVLYVDAFSGISGNMFVGALLDLGVPKDYLQAELNKLALDGYELVIEDTIKCGISATYFNVSLHGHHHHKDEEHSHGHHHAHGDHHHHHHNHKHEHHHEHEHRSLQDILAIIDKSVLNDAVKQKAAQVFRRLGEAEAKVHNKPIEEIHFHEVGAIDTIIDIVGTIVCLDWLKVEEIFVTKVCTGFGYVECVHGTMPVPAPATAELLKNIPYFQGNIEKELATPTGLALLATLANVTSDMPTNFVSEKIGYGAGSYDLAVPNTLRLFLGQTKTQVESSSLLVLETNIDDMNPQFYSHVMSKLFAAGANDVWINPVVMKKGRPACIFSVLMEASLLQEMCKILFAETSTLGVRYYPVQRTMLDRQIIKVQLPYGAVYAKVGKLDNNIINVTPEYEDCSKLSALSGKPLKEVWQDAMQAALQEMKN